MRFAALVDPALNERSGSTFYSGRAAFSKPAPIYVLGLNPGGSPQLQADETIERDLKGWVRRPERWSAYKDESWRDAKPGTWGMQPRILRMLVGLGFDPHDIPASNLIFVRTSNEAGLAKEKADLLSRCWPVHRAIIEELEISTILCLGGTAGRWVRSRLEATQPGPRFKDRNRRGWTSRADLNEAGVCVLTVTHPGRAEWRNSDADPTPLVKEMLIR
jgi:hypothetical protein